MVDNERGVNNQGRRIPMGADDLADELISEWKVADPETKRRVLEMLRSSVRANKQEYHLSTSDQPLGRAE
jgi:hypothetical protein